jgi:effector-binding domain-containing protein
MNRWLSASCILLVLVIAAIYIFIPSQLTITLLAPTKCNVFGADRILGNTGKWSKWWPENVEGPGGPDKGTGGLEYDGVNYQPGKRLMRSVEINIDDKESMSGMLSVFPAPHIDSCYLQFQFGQRVSLNPLKRIHQYREAQHLKVDIEIVLDRFRTYLQNMQNVYGLTMVEESTPGSLVEQTTRVVGEYPNTDTIYMEVGKLERFLAAHGSKKAGVPIMNITALANGRFKLRVALPTDKVIPNSGNIESAEVPTDKFLQADVHGGEGAVRAAFGNMENYISDYGRTIVAIPFASLITDRRLERDSAKWVTRIYYPLIPH